MINWKTQTMTFKWEGREVFLLGDPALRCSKIAVKGLTKVLKKEKRGILIECHGLCGDNENSDITVPLFLSQTVA